MPKALGPNCPKQFLRPQNSKLWDLNFFFHANLHKILHKTTAYFQIMSQFDRVMSVYSQKIAKKTLQKSAWCHLEQWSNKAYGTFLVPKAVDYVTLWSNGLVIKALDSQSRGSIIKTTGWLQGWPSLILLG